MNTRGELVTWLETGLSFNSTPFESISYIGQISFHCDWRSQALVVMRILEASRGCPDSGH